MRIDRQDYGEFHESAESLRESFPREFPARSCRNLGELNACDGCGLEFDARAIDGGLCWECGQEVVSCDGCGDRVKRKDTEDVEAGTLCMRKCLAGGKLVEGISK